MINAVSRISLFGMQIDRVNLQAAARRICTWVGDDHHRCRYVVTPNLDHVVQFQQNDALRRAYSSAAMVVADGWPLVTASRMFSAPLPERVAGSDLVPAVFDAAATRDEPLRVFLLGAASGVADIAAANIERRWPGVRVVGTHSPPFGFERDDGQNGEIIKRVNAARPDVLLVGFGAPKQELWLQQHHQKLTARVAIAGGATIDFFAGRQTRAPVWVRRMKLEWLFRLATDPRRLASRYASNAMQLPGLLLRERRSRSEPPTSDRTTQAHREPHTIRS